MAPEYTRPEWIQKMLDELPDEAVIALGAARCGSLVCQVWGWWVRARDGAEDAGVYAREVGGLLEFIQEQKGAVAAAGRARRERKRLDSVIDDEDA